MKKMSQKLIKEYFKEASVTHKHFQYHMHADLAIVTFRSTVFNFISDYLRSILFYLIIWEDRRGTTDEFATIPFHPVLFSAAIAAKSIPDHSLILSSHLFFMQRDKLSGEKTQRELVSHIKRDQLLDKRIKEQFLSFKSISLNGKVSSSRQRNRESEDLTAF